jgi:aminopeptidase N
VVVLHEMGHEWFYATVATNEAEEPWLDEGLTDFSTIQAATRYYGGKTSMMDAGVAGLGYGEMQRLVYLAFPRVPMYARSWDLSSLEYGVAAYSKPGVVLATLKNILGAETFGRVMRTFAERYRFKHPRTQDFTAVAQEVSGQNLEWFFDQAVYGRGVLDYAVESATTRRTDMGSYHSQVVLARKGEVKFPLDVLVTFSDGTARRQVWDGQAVSQTLMFDTSAPLAHAALDPDKKYVMELNTVDNSLTVQPEAAPLMRFASRWLFWMQVILDFGF